MVLFLGGVRMSDNNLKLANCPYCDSDNIDIVSGVTYGAKCMSCYKIKVQCCDSKEEVLDIWNRLFLGNRSLPKGFFNEE